ncbi:MAG: PhnD/SsuA/transferrin family substrate-binding protein [Planctomycetia bacterium]|nr:PhnD/SsuA/transferrin family substrate-binding protein [Planctomycetia bacterium]
MMLWPKQSIGWCLAIAVAVGGLLTIEPTRASETAKPSKPTIQIGMIGSLFRDVPDSLVDLMAKPFGTLMATQTGMNGNLVKTGDARDLGRRLMDQQVHVGIFHGFEFAWARQVYPDLRPLCIAVNQEKHLRALLVVKADSDVGGFADLKEKKLNFPKGSRGHCHLFLETCCQECGQCSPQEYLSQVVASGNAEDALDEVVDGEAAAVLIDGIALDCYKRRKPGRCNQLKVAVESPIFPAGVVAYRKDSLDDATLKRFKDGLVGAHKTILGKQLLTMWKLTGFEAVPDDYDQILENIAKVYPLPAE